MNSIAHDPFWKLEEAEQIDSQCAFYNRLDEKNHLKSIIYSPDHLGRVNPSTVQRIEGKRFEKVSFSKTTISDVIFHNCTFHQCQLIATKIENCEFHGCQFVETNTHKIAIKETYLDPLSFSKCLNRRTHQNIGVHLYRELLLNSRNERQVEFERDAFFLFFRWKRYQDAYELRNGWSNATKGKEYLASLRVGGNILLRLGWEKLFGCGVRLRYFILTVLFTLVLTTCLNYALRVEFGLTLGENPISSWSEAFYFTTVSLTTLGYGDITPTTMVGRVAASIQSVIGFFLFALSASMLFMRMAP